MRIERFRDLDNEHLRERRKDLLKLLSQPSEKERRPCASCDCPCPCSDSITCCCQCSLECPLAARYLSSDPDHYPIEKGILPLVYKLNVLRVIETCWSCEGHTDEKGEIRRLPQVWFYSPSVIYPQLIAEVAQDMLLKGTVESTWEVEVYLHGKEDWATTFALVPRVLRREQVDILSLKIEARSLAMSLPDRVRKIALEHLHKI